MFEHQILSFLKKHHYRRVIPRAALIDMDGTLYDSMPNHAMAWQHMAQEAGLESRPEEFLLWEGRTGASVIDILARRSWNRPATDEEKVEYYRRKTEYFRLLPEPRPMPGAAAMLKVLEDTHIARVLVTGSGQNSLIDRLDTDFPGAFSPTLRVTAHNVTHGKPHPEPFLKGMQLARVSPSQALAIDNAPLGVESGVRSGAFTIGVRTGDIPLSALADAGAAVVFSSMPEMAELLPMLLLDLLRTVREV